MISETAATVPAGFSRLIVVHIFFPKIFFIILYMLCQCFSIVMYSENISHVIKHYFTTQILIAVWYSII